MTVPEHTVFGFVGENGAGKTTTMKLILGLDKPDAGEIRIKQQIVTFGQNKTNRLIGYLPDVPVFYDFMTAQEYLMFCAEITAIPKKVRQHKIDSILTRVHLSSSKKIRSFSRGMKQRLGIAQALLNEPELLLCDEPTSALDPEGRHDFLALLQQLKGQMTIVFSTHILSDVQAVCDQVGILHQGQMSVCGPLKDLEQTYFKSQIELGFKTSARTKQAQKLLAVDFTSQIQSEKLIVDFQGDYEATSQRILTVLLAHQLVPLSFRQTRPTLEQIFLKVTQ